MMLSIVSTDRKRRVEIVTDKAGLFRFIEHTDVWDDNYAVPAPVWTPTHFSGLYATAEAAEVEARAVLPWLSDSISN